MRRRRRGFTLIELMIVVAIIGILASIAIPKFADLLRKSKEGATKGNLGALRSTLNIYYADNEGNYPAGAYSTNSNIFSANLTPRYVDKIPVLELYKHTASANVFLHWQWAPGDNHDNGIYGYDGYLPIDSGRGMLWVFCTHTDTKGTSWSLY